MKIWSVNDAEFNEYGRVVDNVDFSELVEAMKKTPVPEGVAYEPGIKELESLSVAKEISSVVYGEMPVQIGYCNGHNCMLNALEYHRDSEINVAATDAILMLGLKREVEKDFTFDTSKVKAFFVGLKLRLQLVIRPLCAVLRCGSPFIFPLCFYGLCGRFCAFCGLYVLIYWQGL